MINNSSGLVPSVYRREANEVSAGCGGVHLKLGIWAGTLLDGDT
jgi:hypothetical protein